MARYEFKEGSSSKFWEIELDGKAFTVSWGKIGATPTTQTKKWPDAATAQKEHDKLVASKVKKGYQLAGGKSAAKTAKPGGNAKASKPAASGATASDPKLEAAILANPDKEDAWLVYADWLQSKNDPRGELVVLQHRNKTKEANALIKKHGLLGDLAKNPPPIFKLTWKLGFIQRAEIGWPYSHEEGRDDDNAAAKKFEAFLDLPVARFVQDLHLGPAPPKDLMYLYVFGNVIEKKRPPALRKLYLGERGDWDFQHSFSEMPDCDAIRGLHSLSLDGGQVTLPKSIDLPELREFSLEAQGVSKKDLAAVGSAKWPKLERLDLSFGSEEYGADGSLKNLAPILAGTGLKKLKHLALRTCDELGEIVAALPKSKILRQLETLQLSNGRLGDEHVDQMLASGAFKHLAMLDLSDNFISKAGAKKAKGLAKKVEIGSQEEAEDPEDRYVSCSE